MIESCDVIIIGLTARGKRGEGKWEREVEIEFVCCLFLRPGGRCVCHGVHTVSSVYFEGTVCVSSVYFQKLECLIRLLICAAWTNTQHHSVLGSGSDSFYYNHFLSFPLVPLLLPSFPPTFPTRCHARRWRGDYASSGPCGERSSGGVSTGKA
jgi:hypothetical protein